jgi:tetratricopeptide (TPR) repeat protein
LSRWLDSARFTREASAALIWAYEAARRQGANEIDLPHLMYGASQEPIGYLLLKRAGADPQLLAESLKGSQTLTMRSDRIPATQRTNDALRRAHEQAVAWSHPAVTSGHLVLACAGMRTGWGRSFGSSVGIDAKSLRPVAESFPMMATDLETSDLFAQLLGLDWIDDETRAWLERKHIRYSMQNIEDLRSSAALLRSTADGDGLSRYPDLGVFLGGLTGDTSLTLRSYEKAQSFTPAWADFFRLSGALALAQRGEFEAAREIVGSLLAREQSSSFFVNAAQIEYVAGRVEDALAYLAKASPEIGQESKATRQAAEILWHSIDGGFEDALTAIVDTQPKDPYARHRRGSARIALARDACLAGDIAASNELYEVSNEYERYGMEGVVLKALALLAESQQTRGDQRFEETRRRAVELATRLGQTVRLRRLMSL